MIIPKMEGAYGTVYVQQGSHIQLSSGRLLRGSDI